MLEIKPRWILAAAALLLSAVDVDAAPHHVDHRVSGVSADGRAKVLTRMARVMPTDTP